MHILQLNFSHDHDPFSVATLVAESAAQCSTSHPFAAVFGNGDLIMHRLHTSPWQFTGLCIFGVLIGSKGLLTVTAAVIPEDVLDASDVADRESDSYSLDAFVWRDSMPLVITGFLHKRSPIENHGLACAQTVSP